MEYGREQGNGSSSWVAPFEKYPDFRIHLDDLGQAEKATIADKFKVGRRSKELSPVIAAEKAIAKRAILEWEGVPAQVMAALGLTNDVTDEGKELFFKPVFFDRFDEGGERVRKSLYELSIAKLYEEKEIDLKN